MPKNKKDQRTASKLKIRGGKKIAEDLTEANTHARTKVDNPIKRPIKLYQFPWTERQKDFFKVALHPSTKIVIATGPAGTAKTLLATYCALQLLNMGTIESIMYLRSAVESSDRSLGFLPGTAEEKLRFFNLPFLDKLDELLLDSRAEKLEQENRISMFPVNFARGMNWTDKCVILDEAQNSTVKEITTVLTRLGKNSRCFILADPMQTDLKQEDKQGGVGKITKRFLDEESLNMGIYTLEFDEDDIVRSELVKFIVSRLKDL